MRGALPTCLLLAALSAGCWQSPAPASAPEQESTTPARGGVPSWVPARTAAQEALLAPTGRAIRSPAEAVYPDLDRFGYAPNRPLEGAEDAVKFTRMVTQVLNDSPRFYTLEELPAGAANLVAQYGPAPAEPDGWKIVKRGAGDVGTLTEPPGLADAKAALSKGDALLKGGDLEGAIAAYREGLVQSPLAPALRMALAGALAKAGRGGDAELAYREILAADPTFAPAHLALAEMADKRNDLPALRKSLAEALAYHPPSKRGLELLRRLAGTAPPAGKPGAADGGWYDPPPDAGKRAPSVSAEGGRPHPFPIFLDVDGAGAIHVATERTEAAQIYGGCRAVVRYEPEVRAQIFQSPREAPYFLTVAEEVVCLEAGLGAYLHGRSEGKKADPDLERLSRLAREEGLSGYVMFEILGQHRPERARTAPSDVHRDTVQYLERWILTRREAIPEGVLTAER
jgi:tetratricopeptide (TPR) repeat protein